MDVVSGQHHPLREDIQTHNPGGVQRDAWPWSFTLGDMEAQGGGVAGPGSHGGGLLAFTQMGYEPAQLPLASNKGRDSRVETPQKPEMRLAL